ncbi:MAG: response regulator transcription factor [Bacteroidetes bacterium]|nr:response regulator transcription factor [Bacteroidota bacterium]
MSTQEDIQEKKKRISVWIVDDNKSFCVVLSEALNRSNSITCDRYFHSSRQAIEFLETNNHPPQVILLDIKMPGTKGVDAIESIKRIAPSTNIIMLTSYDFDTDIRTSLKRGASGYLLKSSQPMDIIRAIQTVQKGGTPLDPMITQRMTDAFIAENPESDAYNLSAREREVIRWISQGMNSAEVAQQLSITYNTVETHIKNIFHKLNVSNRHAMVAKAIKERLI